VTSKIQKAAMRIQSYGWTVRAELIRSGIGVEQSLRLSLKDLELRRPRIRKKPEKEQVEADIRTMEEALAEIPSPESKEVRS